MGAVTLYEVSIATFAKGLNTLIAILQKAQECAKENGKDADVYASAALCEDMKPLVFQILVASNTVKKSIWRLTGVEIESWPDDETTMDQLVTRVQRTLDLVESVTEESIAGRDDVVVELQMGKAGTFNLPAKAYVLNYAVPNFFFHLQTAYAILRSQGVPLGKMDYLKSFMA